MKALKQLQKFDDAMEAIKTKIKDTGEALLIQAFQEELFSKYPNVEAVRMRGYAPYFNDGDPCYFSTGEPYIQFAGESGFRSEWDDVEECEDCGNELDTCDCEREEDFVPVTDELLAEVNEITGEIFSTFGSDSFEITFGSDQEVTFFKDGTVTNEEYGQHD